MSVNFNQKASTESNQKLTKIIHDMEYGSHGRWTSGVGSSKLMQLKKIKERVERGQEKVDDLINAAHEIVCRKRYCLHFWKTPESQIDFEEWLQENKLTEFLNTKKK